MINFILNITNFLYQKLMACLHGLKRLARLFASGIECWIGIGMYIIFFSNYNGTIEAKEAKDLLKFYATISLGLTSLLIACVALVKEDIKKSHELKNMVIRSSCFLTTILGISALSGEGILLVTDSAKIDVSALSAFREMFLLTVLSMLFLILEILKTTINREDKKNKTSWYGDKKMINIKKKKGFSIIDKLFTKNT